MELVSGLFRVPYDCNKLDKQGDNVVCQQICHLLS